RGGSRRGRDPGLLRQCPRPPRGHRDRLLAVGRPAAAGLLGGDRPVHGAEPRRLRADHPAGLGRLLDEADGQLRGRGRPRCLRRSPGALPRVRPARGDLPAGWSGPARRNPAGAIPRGSAGAVDRRGRSSLRPAQGLRHDRDHVRPEDARGGGSDARGPRGPGLEPRGRRHLRADARATEPRRERGARGREGFDPTRVARYGMAADPGIDYTGQTSWSPFALSTGWTFTDEETWGRQFNYDDDRFSATMDWYFGLVDKGFFPPFGEFGDSSPTQTQVQSGTAALAVAGSWMITT